MTEPATTSPPRPKPPRRTQPAAAKRPAQPKPDPEGFVEIAKRVVADNYNASRDETHAPEIEFKDLFIVSYSRILQNWEVVITSPVARRLLWVVSFNNYRNEVYLSVYQKINVGKVSLPDKVSS
jgi:Family of unknown function (DUF6275)